MKNEKLKCPNEVNLAMVRAEIQAIEPSAEIYLLPDNTVQIIHDTDTTFNDVVNNHDGSAQNAAEIALAQWESIKEERTKAVEAITVVVDGMEFDGDEESQTRMSRAITGLEPGETQLWKLTDNSIVYPTREQLKAALRLAGEQQTLLWAQYVPQ